MAMPIQMMSAPVTESTQNTLQELRLASNVSQVDTLDLLLNVYDGTDVAIEIWTGMQNETEDGWVQLGAFTTTLDGGNSEKKTFTNPLAFIRWKLASSGSGTFMITGVGRQS